MKQSKISHITKAAVERPLEFTNKVLEHSKKLQYPSKKVDKIGSSIGIIVSFGILATGIGWILYGKPLWGITCIITSIISIVTNRIGYYSRKKKLSV